jgi:CHASE3 domain sensor protein
MRPSALLRAAFVLNVIVTIAVMGLAYRMAERSEDSGQRVGKSHQALEAAEELLRLVTEAETGTRGYLLTGDRAYLQPFERARIAIPDQLAELSALARTTAPLRTTRLPSEVQQTLDALSAMVATVDEGTPVAAASREAARMHMEEVRQTILGIRRDEFAQLNTAIEADEHAGRIIEWVAIVGTGLAMCLLSALGMALLVLIRPGLWRGGH